MNLIKHFNFALVISLKVSLFICLFLSGSCSTEKKNEPVEIKKYSVSESITNSENEFPDKDISGDIEEETSDKKESKVSPDKAIDHIGEIVTVNGFVSDVHVSEKVAYLNFGKKFPKNDFSGVVFSGKFSEFGDLDRFRDKLVEITGSVSVYRNKPQIILNSLDQIKILN